MKNQHLGPPCVFLVRDTYQRADCQTLGPLKICQGHFSSQDTFLFHFSYFKIILLNENYSQSEN